MRPRNIFAILIMLLSLTACATTGTDNTTYASPAGIGPVRGTGNNFY